MFQCLCVCARACVCVCVCVCACVQVCVIGFTVSQQFPKSQAFGHGQGEGVVYRKWTDVDKGGGGGGVKKPQNCANILYRWPVCVHLDFDR